MKTQNCLATAIVLMVACLILAVPAMASSEVYSNGPYNLNGDGWTINFGYSVSDSFYLGAVTQVNGVVFWVWEFPGDTMTSVRWQISGGPILGKGLPGGIADTTNSKGQGLLVDWSNPFGYSPDRISLALPVFNLPPGTYWITLSSAVASNGDPVFWNENDGVGCTGWLGTKKGCPSSARENVVGVISSEAFSIWAK